MLRSFGRVGVVFLFVVTLLRAQSIAPEFAPSIDSDVHAMVVQLSGRIVIGGAFVRVAGQSRSYLARLNADGTFDASFAARPSSVVEAILQQPDGKLIITGQFTTINALPYSRIARLNADGSLDTSFDPSSGIGSGAGRQLLQQPDGKIVVAGSFETAGGEAHEGIARFNANGTLDRSFNVRVTGVFVPNATPGVLGLAGQADGALILAGQFLSVNGQPRNGLARVRADGTLDPTFVPSSTASFYAAVVLQPDGKILVGGGFSSLAGQPRLARLNADGTRDPSFAPRVNDSVASLFLEPDGRIVISGYFSFVNDQPRVGLARLMPWGAVDPAFRFDLAADNPRVEMPVADFVRLPGGRAVLAGNFNSIGGVARAYVAQLTTETPSRLANLSTRGLVGPGGNLAMGFVARGGTKSVLLRGVGPTLATFGVSGALADPQIEAIYSGEARADVTNLDWASDQVMRAVFAAVGAFPLADFSKDAATTATLTDARSVMTARVSSQIAGASGIALVEAYDRNPTEAGRLVNLSTLGFAGSGAQALSPGFVIIGESSKRVLIRAVGPGLGSFGLSGLLTDPQIAVVPQGVETPLASNDNWGGDAALAAAFTAAGAFALPANSRDAALVVQLPPGAYTAVVSGVGNTTGTVLVELYDLDP